MRLTVGSLFSGVGGFDLGFAKAGCETRWFCEIDGKCRSVLARHFPGVPLYEDVTQIDGAALEPVDIIAAGFPCQDLSVAGQRRGLKGERSGLYWEIPRVVREMREATNGACPTFVVLENVPGLLSSHGGRDMATVLWGLLDCGARDVGWSVLDAQWFGVAQRRRRVFVVADFRGERAAQILFEPESLSGHPAPRREAGQDLARSLSGSAGSGRNKGHDHETYVPEVSYAVAAGQGGSKFGSGRHNQDTFVAYQCHGTNVGPMGTLREGDGGVTSGVPSVLHATPVANTLTQESASGYDASEDGTGRTNLVAYSTKLHNTKSNQSGKLYEEYAPGLHHNSPPPAVRYNSLQQQGMRLQGGDDADATQTRSREVLRALRQAAGAEAFEEWGLGVLAALQSPQVLRQNVHGGELRGETGDDRPELVGGAPEGQEDHSAGAVWDVWSSECVRRASQEWRLDRQQAGELGAYLSLLPHQGTSGSEALSDLWEAAEGLGLLRQALSTVQEVRRPAGSEGESAYPAGESRGLSRAHNSGKEVGGLAATVRRLTPRLCECERLQGFPDDWTAGQADSARYRQMGNAVAVPCAAWIAQRIVEAAS